MWEKNTQKLFFGGFFGCVGCFYPT